MCFGNVEKQGTRFEAKNARKKAVCFAPGFADLPFFAFEKSEKCLFTFLPRFVGFLGKKGSKRQNPKHSVRPKTSKEKKGEKLGFFWVKVPLFQAQFGVKTTFFEKLSKKWSYGATNHLSGGTFPITEHTRGPETP